MEMDDAGGTITLVLSVIDRTPTSDESACPAPEHALNPKSTLIGNLQLGSSTTRTSFVPPTAQNFRIILRSSCIVKNCKEVSRPLVRRARILLGSDPGPQIVSIATAIRHSADMVRHTPRS